MKEGADVCHSDKASDGCLPAALIILFTPWIFTNNAHVIALAGRLAPLVAIALCAHTASLATEGMLLAGKARPLLQEASTRLPCANVSARVLSMTNAMRILALQFKGKARAFLEF